MDFLSILSDLLDALNFQSDGSNRKRVFTPGFVTLCAFVAIVELVVLNGIYAQP